MHVCRRWIRGYKKGEALRLFLADSVTIPAQVDLVSAGRVWLAKGPAINNGGLQNAIWENRGSETVCAPPPPPPPQKG